MIIRYFILFNIFLLISCASSAKLREESITKPSSGGDYQSALDAVIKNKKKLYNSADTFLYEFDLGLLYHYNKDYKQSIKHLANAEQIIDDLYSRSVSNEAAALLTNDNVRPYRSYPFEEQWMHKVQILNYLALNDIDGAVVQSRRALLAIQSLQEKEEDKFNEDASLQYLIALAFERQLSEDDARIAYDKAKEDFGNAIPKQAAEPPQYEQEIIIIGYAGLSPILRENKFWGTYAQDGVLFLHYKDANGDSQTLSLVALGLGGPGFSGQTTTIQFALPQMLYKPSKTSKFLVKVNDEQKTTQTFSDTKYSLEKDLENKQNSTILRTAGRVIVRTIAASKAKDKMQTENALVNILLNLGTDFATNAIEEADLRLGSAMPLTLQILRVPAKVGVNSVRIDAVDSFGAKIKSFQEQNINLKAGEKAFVFVPMLM